MVKQAGSLRYAKGETNDVVLHMHTPSHTKFVITTTIFLQIWNAKFKVNIDNSGFPMRHWKQSYDYSLLSYMDSKLGFLILNGFFILNGWSIHFVQGLAK